MSITLALNRSQPDIALACLLILVGMVAYRVTRILVTLVVNAAIIAGNLQLDREKPGTMLQKMAEFGLIGAAAEFACALVLIALRLLVSAARALLLVMYALLPLVMLSALMALIQVDWYESMAVLTDAFDGPLSSTVRTLLLMPLRLLGEVGPMVIPAYNLLVFSLFQFPLQFLRWLFEGAGAYQLLLAVYEVRDLFPALAGSAKSFVDMNAGGCPARWECLPSTLVLSGNGTVTADLCAFPTAAAIAKGCLDPAARELDLIPAFTHAQQAVSRSIIGLGASCESLAVLLNVTLFPLADPSLWYALDRAVNTGLHVVAIAPIMAAKRCALAGGFSERPAMCTPDLRPAFVAAVDAALSMGDVVTHWFDAAWVLLFDHQETIGQACAAANNYSGLLDDDPVGRAMFGPNATALVRMLDASASGAAAVFALTDGLSVMYVQENPLVKRYAPQIWPFAVNPHFGIARMWLPDRNDAALFGCACQDVSTDGQPNRYSPTMVRIECAAVVGTNPAIARAYAVPLQFDSLYEPQWLSTCDRVRVNVESLRWQIPRAVERLARSSSGGSSSAPPVLMTADAAVWIVPICGAQDGVQSLACMPERIFLMGSCFPYCLAAHLQSDGLDRPLVARGEAQWTSGVLLAARDCASSSSAQQPQQGGGGSSSETVCTVSADASGGPLPQAAFGTAGGGCSYASTCTTFVSNRSLFSQYSLNASVSSSLLPARDQWIRNGTSPGSRLILEGQPLVIGGGVLMVQSRLASTGEARMDFPAIVGQTDGEFTVETLTPQGIPVGSLPPTPAMLARAVSQAYMDSPPPSYVQSNGVVPVNPGVVLRDGSLMYVTNPSYDQLYAFAMYCRSKGAVAQTQIMLLSNFQSMRIQRAHTGDGCGSFYSSSSSYYACRSDLFTAAPIGDNPVPTLTSEQVRQTSALYDLCASGQTFNLYAESLEWFDDANVVVAMRRGTVADLASALLSSSSPEGGTVAGRTVFYFVQQADVGQSRLGVPWPTSPLFLLSSTGTSTSLKDQEVRLFQSCSALRALPDVGGAWGKSMAALLELASVVVNGVFNPFAFVELIDARAAQACPEDGLMHSALTNCGTALYSLDAAFAQTYAASTAIWDVGAWGISLILPSSSSGGGGVEPFLSDFLSGAAVLGDATHISGFYGVPQLMTFAEVNAESILEEEGGRRRRRRLLGAATLVRHVNGATRLGVRGFAGLVHGLMQLVSSGSTFSGADLGAVISGQGPPTTLATSLLAAPPVAWSHFTYRVVAPALVDIVALIRRGNGGLSAVASPLFLYVQTAMDAFDSLVDARHRQACVGARFMAGYSSQLGLWLHYNCLAGLRALLPGFFLTVIFYLLLIIFAAGADLVRSTLVLGATLAVDVPLYRCMCVQPGGEDYLAYVSSRCAQYIPSQRKAFWQVIMMPSCLCPRCLLLLSLLLPLL